MAPWTADGDAQMTDAHGRNSRENQENDPNSQDQHDVIADRNRIRVLPGASDTAASFEIENEDHTLGNALSPDVELCGYTIPHPSEAKMNLRIQTYDTTTVYEAFDKGFDDLMSLCNIVIEKFTAARDAVGGSTN